MACFLLCCPAQHPFAPSWCDAIIASIPWHRPPMSAALAHIPVVAKTSFLAAGTKEGKGLNLEEVINLSWQDQWRTMAERTGQAWTAAALLAHLGKLPPSFIVQHKMRSQRTEAGTSLAKTSRLDTVFLTHLLWHSFEKYTEKLTVGYMLVYMFPCSHYIKRYL